MHTSKQYKEILEVEITLIKKIKRAMKQLEIFRNTANRKNSIAFSEQETILKANIQKAKKELSDFYKENNIL